MKVGVYLIHGISPSAGGNFSYYDRLINAIDTHTFSPELEVCFVGRIRHSDVKSRRKYIELCSPFLHNIFRFLKKIQFIKVLSKIFSGNADLCNRQDLSILKQHGVDLILYPKQLFYEVDYFPFISMNWDAGHKSTFAFPEFADGYEIRENWFNVGMQKGLAIIVESQSSRKEFLKYFSIHEDKIQIVPLFPGGVVDLHVDDAIQNQLLSKLGLTSKAYFFYPAQFWAHKNHFNLITAFKKLSEHNRSKNLRLVFTGSNKGNKDYILSVIKQNNLDDQILVLGFVSNEEVYTLYKHAIALVMPTFLGPTNMPLLEARALQTAIICSDLDGHHEMCKDGALYANPVLPDEWFSAMNTVLDETLRDELIRKSDEIMKSSPFNILDAMKELDKVLLKFIPVRKTFGFDFTSSSK